MCVGSICQNHSVRRCGPRASALARTVLDPVRSPRCSLRPAAHQANNTMSNVRAPARCQQVPSDLYLPVSNGVTGSGCLLTDHFSACVDGVRRSDMRLAVRGCNRRTEAGASRAIAV
jgi:hypothetical protein